MSMRILVLGGYGNFGARISRRIAAQADCTLIVAGRDRARAEAFAANLPATAQAAALDTTDARFAAALAALAPDLVIHAAGPFQAQDYRVARAALAAGAHYVDLADGRDFVRGFAAALDAEARAADRIAVTGASSVPGLSAAAIDALRPAFAAIDRIEIGISPGNRSERGLATVRAILGYVGRPYRVWRGGAWCQTHGWSTLKRMRYPAPVGVRWLSDCEVPDLDLFPERYAIRDRLDFRAGLELRSLHFGLWCASALRRIGLVRDWSRHAEPLAWIAERLQGLGSDAGAMHVEVTGRGRDDAPLRQRFSIVASAGSGPEIPCTAAVLLAERLRRGHISARGARPCLDLFTLDEFLAALAPWPMRSMIERID